MRDTTRMLLTSNSLTNEDADGWMGPSEKEVITKSEGAEKIDSNTAANWYSGIWKSTTDRDEASTDHGWVGSDGWR